MPYGRCVTYSYRGDKEQLIERARTGLLPILKKSPGFIAYGVIVQDDQAVSISAWNTESDAQAAAATAKEWIVQNADMTVMSAVIGEFAWLDFADQ
jgi:heme-degrading monooxygenase HmoA